MRVLITGATGLIGSRISAFCRQRNIAVNYLTRHKSKIENKLNYQGFYWNPNEEEIDSDCLKGVSAIINLAGANLFNVWTNSYKQTLRESRIASLELLFDTLKNYDNEVEQLVCASAIGIYPSSFQKIYNEDENEKDASFLGELLQSFEETADKFSTIGIDVAKIRTGMVLAKQGGALPIFAFSVKKYMGALLGSGNQWQSWIHIDDIAEIYLFAVSKRLDGIYNAVAPNPVTNKELTMAIASHFDKPLWLPKIPKTLLKTFMGEMSEVALSSQLVASKKIEQMGYKFEYNNINKALEDLL